MSDQWSDAEDGKLLRAWCADEPPKTIREIADELNRTKSSVDRRINALGIRGHKGDRREYEKQTGVAIDPLIRPVRMDSLAPPTGETVGSEYSVLVWGDLQFPFHDPGALEVLRLVAKELKPTKLVCIGDVFDFYEISDYRAPREADHDLQATLNQGVQHLADMAELAEPSEAHFLAGNHEDRWDRLLGRARADVRFRQLMNLPKVKRFMEFEEVVGFEELGYQYRPYTESQALVENDRLVYTHGETTVKWAARAMLDQYGKNIIFGHTHRIQSYTKRDLKGQEAGWNIGCLCRLDPHFQLFADWQHGFMVVTWTKVKGVWYFDAEQVRIHDGTAIWRGQVFNSKQGK